MAQPSAIPSPDVPGPVDRESFFAAQRRHRRTARRYGTLTTIGVPLVGIPLSALLTPPLLMVAFAVLHVSSLSLAFLSPEGLAESLRWIRDTFGPLLSDPGRRKVVAAVGLPLLLIGPGALAQLLLYLRVRRLFRTAGAEGLLAELGAREPRPEDLAERRLGNLVAEMGIAAGLRPPKVMIVDSTADGGTANGAAVVGSSPDEATIVLGRALLDQLDRDAIQATIAYLVASAGNGDLQVFTTTIAARITTHAVQYVLETRTDPRAGSVRRALMLPVHQRDRQRVHDLLATLRSEPDQGLGSTRPMPIARPRRSPVAFLAAILAKPFYPLFGLAFAITSPCYSICSAILWSLFMKPWQARFLRARSAYADAAAVQLLRMADPVARAVAVGGENETEMVMRMREELRTVGRADRFQEIMRTETRLARARARLLPKLGGGWPVDLSMFLGAEASNNDQWIRPRPKPGQRLWRLKRLGAKVERGAEAPRPLLIRLILRTLAAPFVAAWYVIGLGLVGFFMFIATFIGLTVFGMVYGLMIGLLTVIVLLVKLARSGQ